MSEAERRRFLTTLRRDDDFRIPVRRELLIEDLLSLPQTVATLVDVVAQQRQDFTALATDVRNFMERTITVVSDGFGAIRGEIAELRGGFLGEIRSEVTKLRSDMAAGFAAVDARFDQVDADIRDLRDRLAS